MKVRAYRPLNQSQVLHLFQKIVLNRMVLIQLCVCLTVVHCSIRDHKKNLLEFFQLKPVEVHRSRSLPEPSEQIIAVN